MASLHDTGLVAAEENYLLFEPKPGETVALVTVSAFADSPLPSDAGLYLELTEEDPAVDPPALKALVGGASTVAPKDRPRVYAQVSAAVPVQAGVLVQFRAAAFRSGTAIDTRLRITALCA